MAWSRVARPVELGGVSVIDLMTMGYALWLCWEWLARTEPQRLWTAMPSKTERVVLAMFEASVTVQIGNGAQTLFWHDRLVERLIHQVPCTGRGPSGSATQDS
jgi:hypothetical protein